MLDKKSLRKKVLAARDSLTWDQVEANSVKIAEQLFALPQYRAAQTIMYFLNFGKEVLTMKMVPQTLAHGKRAVATKTVTKERRMILSEIYDLEADLEPGLWGIPEPKAEALRPLEPTEIDFVIVPGVAFDLQGNRWVMVAVIMTAFFPSCGKVYLVAVTFELQIVKEVPVDPWDRRVDFIITEKRVIDCR